VPDRLDAIADTIAAATEERRAIPRLTLEHPELTADEAYDAQWRGIERRLNTGERLVGLKLGLTSTAKQRTMGVDEPLYGWLTNGMIAEPGRAFELDRFIHPRVEPEIAFLLGEELRGPTTVTEVLAATRAVFPALEIIDSRYADFSFQLPDVIADNASAAAVVMGSTAVPPQRAGDLRLVGCVLRVDGEVVHTAAGAAVLGHPAAAVAWAINRLSERGGSLRAGSIVLAGALTDAVPLSPGTTVVAEFDGLGVAEVAV
jgi:2-oxo-3-hexenedioate decarboxylase